MTRLSKKLALSLILTVSVLIMAAVSVYLEIKQFGKHPAGAGDVEQRIEIRSGASIHETIESLHRAGLIASPIKFKLLMRLKGRDKQIKAGEYMMSARMTPDEILNSLVNGQVRLYRITVPEGYTSAQIATLVQRDLMISAEDFMRTCADRQLLDALGVKADSFEGYLFPDTYLFSRDAIPAVIIRTMVAHFHARFKPEWKERAKEMGFSVHEIVTLASIIEKETGAEEERPIVASVFHNRLKKGMRLESDPTTIYGIKNFDGDLTREHLTTLTPYNTYKIAGLPAGPIANPGERSIEAALYPAETPYYFFVARKDRTHQFSETVDEHNLAVRKYQLGEP